MHWKPPRESLMLRYFPIWETNSIKSHTCALKRYSVFYQTFLIPFLLGSIL